MRTRWILIISLLSLALGSCGGSAAAVDQSPELAPLNPKEISTEEPASNPLENPLELAGTPETTDMTSTPLDEDKLVNLVKQDLANHLKIDLAQITLLKTLEIKSPNISAGCKPGAGQIITKGSQVYGYRIWLETGGEEYIYHVGLDEQIIFCPKLTPGANNPLLMTPDGSTPDPQNQSP